MRNVLGSLMAGVCSGYLSHIPHNLATLKLMEPSKSYWDHFSVLVSQSADDIPDRSLLQSSFRAANVTWAAFVQCFAGDTAYLGDWPRPPDSAGCIHPHCTGPRPRLYLSCCASDTDCGYGARSDCGVVYYPQWYHQRPQVACRLGPLPSKRRRRAMARVAIWTPSLAHAMLCSMTPTF